MSVRIMTMVFERYPNGGGEMLLALALADHAHDDGTNIYPSIAQLSVKTRQSERAVQYQLRRMEESGWIELVNDGDGGRGRRREYRLNRAWMKGEEIAPIENPAKGADIAPIDDAKRVQPATGKGANDDGKGCKAIAPTKNRQEPSKNRQKAAPFDAALIDLPEWLDRTLWQSWCADRKKRGKPITEEASRLQLLKLEKYRAEGATPKAVIEHCIEGGYQGLFAPKNMRGGQPAVDMARWWTTVEGIEQQAAIVGVERSQCAPGTFEAAVWVASGDDGPWWDDTKATTYRIAKQMREEGWAAA